MKIIILCSSLFLLSGCAKITDLAPGNTKPGQVDENYVDTNEEVKLLLPWDLFV